LTTLGFLFLGNATLPCEDGADTNDDGQLDLSDPVLWLQHRVLGEGSIPPPGTVFPWFDPTEDPLGCAS